MTELPPLVVDDRAGSGELAPELRAAGLPVTVGRLDAGDFAFVSAADGRAVRVGIERKRLGDVLACITDGRFAGEQLPKMLAAYDVVWLLVDDVWRVDEEGVIEVYAGRKQWRPTFGKRWLGRDLEAWMLTMTVKAGVHVRCVSGPGASARFIAAVYNWFVLGGGYDGHTSHRAVHSLVEAMPLLTQVGRTAATLPTIGAMRAVYVQEAFPTVLAMMTAGLASWAAIAWPTGKGRRMRLGMASALKVWAAIRGEEE